jgi:hypothetical protein
MNEVTTALIAAGSSIVVGFLSLFGVIITNKTAQAVTEERIDELTREVREHNNFARRMPVVEQEILDIKADIRELKKYHTERL